jgi:ubiquinol-cytochrome c reductase cytochrome c1 subunit
VRRLLIALLFAPLTAVAAGGEVALDRAHIDTGDAVSIQRGARTFVNYCLNCHQAAYMRYNRLQDVGLTEQQIKDNLLLTGAKVGDTMKASISAKDAKQWFGVAPPDLSVTARSRGADWLYTYLRTYYRDPARSTGWNNLAFPNVGMPHVLWELQGSQRLETESHEVGGHTVEHKKLVLDQPGALSPAEYDRLVLDLVNYMVFMGEPVRTQRVQIGIAVLFFLSILLLLTWLLKREYWKDVH